MKKENMLIDTKYKLIVIIIKKGLGSKVVATAKKAGAEGGTILLGTGTADKNTYLNILGIDFEPEKEIVLSAVLGELSENVLNAIVDEMDLAKPGKGVGFVLDIKNFSGIAHLLNL